MAKFTTWSDVERHESATMEIIGRSQYADGSVFYAFKATYYGTKREHFVKIDLQGNANGCSCADGHVGRCWHQRELVRLERDYQEKR